MKWILIFVGGGLGSLCRMAIADLLRKHSAYFPYATIAANVISCLILGMIAAVAVESARISSDWKLFWMIGFCGGFSTFSTFTAENFQLIQNGQMASALLNIGVSVFVCLLAFYLGYRLFSNS